MGQNYLLCAKDKHSTIRNSERYLTLQKENIAEIKILINKGQKGIITQFDNSVNAESLHAVLVEGTLHIFLSPFLFISDEGGF